MKKYILQKDNTIQNILIADDPSTINLNLGETLIDYSTITVGELEIGAVLRDGEFILPSLASLDLPNNSIITGDLIPITLSFSKPINTSLISSESVVKTNNIFFENISINNKNISLDLIPIPSSSGDLEVKVHFDSSQLKDTYDGEVKGLFNYSLVYSN